MSDDDEKRLQPVKESRKRILFTGGGGSGSEALARLLSDRYEVHFADIDIEAKPYAVSAKQWHQIPFASESGFIDALVRQCRELSIDLLIPGVDEELLPVARAYKTINCEVLLPPEGFVKMHLDKLTSNIFLRSHGLAAPQTEWFPERHQIMYPCIAKPIHGRGSRGVAVVRSEAELHAHIMLSRLAPGDFIVQELLQGQEYTIMMAADRDGILRAVVPVRVALKRGRTLRATIEFDQTIIDACKAIHEVNPVPGCYNIQLVKTGEGDAKPFEINPRISTTACLAVAAGIDFVDIYLGGKAGNGLLNFSNGLGLRRSWYNEFVGPAKSGARKNEY